MNYLKSEHLKLKHTTINKLIFIAPILVTLFGITFYKYQQMVGFWWQYLILPGLISVLCVMSVNLEKKAGKYYSIFSSPIDLRKFEAANSLILFEKIILSCIICTIIFSIGGWALWESGWIEWGFEEISTSSEFSVLYCLIVFIGIAVTSAWQIPLCLFLARKFGSFFAISINSLLSVFLPAAVSKYFFAWIIPYYWPAKFFEITMGVTVGGVEYLSVNSISWQFIIPVILSVILYILFTVIESENFVKEGIK